MALQVAAGLIADAGGRLLITLRPPDGHLAGFWEFPGGKQEPGETLQACLKREIAEETGLLVEVGSKVREVVHAYEDRTVHLHFFHGSPREGVARPIHCADVAWVVPGRLKEYRFPPADAGVVDEIVAGRILPPGPHQGGA